MSTIAFDSLAASKRLKGAGFTDQEAEAVVEVFLDATTELTTKADLRDLEKSLTIKIGGIAVALFGALCAAFKLMGGA